MRWILLGLPFLVVNPSTATAEAALAHGKLANGADWFSSTYNNETAIAATNAALADCNQNAAGCFIESQFNSTCFALALTENGGWVSRSGEDQFAANNAAIAQCKAWGQGCQIRIQFCDTINEEQVAAQRQRQQQQYEEFTTGWRDCMSDQADACQRALRYPNITPHDQATLLQQVDIIRNLEIRRAEEETAQAQAKESERQQLIAEKAQIDEELQQKQLELQRLATTGLALQKAAEEQHKKDVQQDAAAELERRSQVAALFNACWAGDPVACDAAEQLPLTPMERSDLIGIRQSLIGSGAPPP